MPRGVVPNLPPPDCLVPYIREAGFGGPLEMRAFDYDMPLVSALVERWRLETHSFHLLLGGVHDHVADTCLWSPLRKIAQCIQDVAYHLSLHTDGDPISGCVRDFDQWYGVGTWQMAQDFLGGRPPPGEGKNYAG
ncbi:hypothetical protein PIB30_078644 [Stylosanthes scabra]|uniref:Aminotransferase-like plant mobile domain-containing protein n=1 Tax=Stylosanthes scabra TaxID=79078 RepID=A0ABU6YTM9_9FABA|nr:hypothetical protein [Stylosanthes scabra]